MFIMCFSIWVFHMWDSFSSYCTIMLECWDYLFDFLFSNYMIGVFIAFYVGFALSRQTLQNLYSTAIFLLGGAFTLSFGCLDAAKELHAKLLSTVLRLPMSFFDTTPLGRLINRFSKDVDTLDNVLPWSIRSWLVCFFTVCM